MHKLYRSTQIESCIFLPLCHRDKVRIGVYFLQDNEEDYAGASGAQVGRSALDVTLSSVRREMSSEIEKLE